MLEYKIKRLLLNPHRIKYFYELDAILEYWDKEGKFDENEDLYTATGIIRSANGQYYELDKAARKLVIDVIVNSNIYKAWLKEFEAKEYYRKLSLFMKLVFHLGNWWDSIKKYPVKYLEMMNNKIKNYVDYRFRIETYKQDVKDRFHMDDVRILELARDLEIIKTRIYKKKKSKANKAKKVKK